MRKVASVALVGLLLGLLPSCGPIARGGGGGGGGGGGNSGGEGQAAFTSRCRGDFGASAAAAEFEAFMSATYDFHNAAVETQESLLTACQAMGRELEMPAEALAGGGVEGTRTVCTAVAETLRTEWAAIGEGTEYQVEVRSRPPHCEASFEAYADCSARCDIEVTPAQLELNCTGGEIRGQCSAECSGRCAVDVEAECSGTCEGICEGTCTQRGPDGSCAGQCDGTCRGQCVADVNASCTGECRGSCSVEWERPYCTGHYEPGSVNADCRAACEATVDARMECTRGETEVVVSGGPDAEAQARIAKVQAAVRAGLAEIALIRERVQRLRESGRALGNSLDSLPEAIREVGVGAAACSTGAAADIANSLGSISMSFEVSVSVSASVSASSN